MNFNPADLFNSSAALLRAALAGTAQPAAPLTVLTVKLLFRRGDTVVRFELAGADAAAPTDAETQSWEVCLDQFQPAPAAEPSMPDGRAGRRPAPGADLLLPRGLADDVRYRLAAQPGAAPAHPLWLRLARPYGLLGSVPWERELGAALDRPVLRLPDFPERPAERPDVLENAVLVDPGPLAGADPGDILARTGRLLRAVLAGSSRAATRVHVFTTGEWFDTLAVLADEPRVRVHDPAAAAADGATSAASPLDGAPALRSAAWSNWIAATLAGLGVDAVHLVCRAQRRDNGAEIGLSHSPFDRGELVPMIALDHDELCLLLNRAGAWACSFAPSAAGQRQAVMVAADGFAHRRPGAVLYYDPAADEDAAALDTACRLLFHSTPSQAPRFRHGFLYCHPAFVRGSQLSLDLAAFGVLASQAALLAPKTPLTARLWQSLSGAAPAPAPPSWLGASQRFLESAVFDEARRAAPDVLLTQTAPDQWQSAIGPMTPDAAANRTLADIQSVIANYMKTQGGE
ncbi:hypothetical protein CSQ96_16435 [Janthinobacterium sp. BJB412]|nr:hypothetical protein CSQ96_16435 [Janthinobacterium sp. BJB412]